MNFPGKVVGKWWFDKDGLRWDVNVTSQGAKGGGGDGGGGVDSYATIAGPGQGEVVTGAEGGADIAPTVVESATVVTTHQYSAQVRLSLGV